MTMAAKNNAYYHLWWNPENFGTHPNECMHELQQIANHFHQLKSKYGIAIKYKMPVFNPFAMLPPASLFEPTTDLHMAH